MSNGKILEHKLEVKLVDAVKQIGGLCLKLTNYKGIPDRLVLCNGKAVFVEMKQKGKPLRMEQEMCGRNKCVNFVSDALKKVKARIYISDHSKRRHGTKMEARTAKPIQ